MVRVFDGRRRDVSAKMKKEHGRILSLFGNGNGEFYCCSKGGRKEDVERVQDGGMVL